MFGGANQKQERERERLKVCSRCLMLSGVFYQSRNLEKTSNEEGG